jgi:hypothetical protein
MSVHALELKPEVSVATALKLVKAPLRIPAWSVAILVIIAGGYGYVSGRHNPVHNYVPYVGYPLVLDTTTGKACYSTTPKPSEDGAAGAGVATAGDGNLSDPSAPTGPAIPMCEK